MPNQKEDCRDLDERDRKLIEWIKTNWRRPRLSADETAEFDEQLRLRAGQRRRRGLFRWVLAGGASVAACMLILFVVLQRPGGKDEISTVAGTIQSNAALEVDGANDTNTISTWMDSLTSPIPQDGFMAMLDPEYRAIAAWLSPEDGYADEEKK